MSWVTAIWSAIVSACLTLALIHGLVWWKRREARGNLLFSISAAATSGMAACEVWMMHARTTAQFGEALRWVHVPAWLVIVSLVWLVRVHLRAGRAWLAWTVCGVRTLSLALNFLFSPNLNFREITELRRVALLGEAVSVGHGVSNPWMLVGQVSLVLLVVFALDAAITVWRRGERRQAILLSGSIAVFVTLGSGQAILVLWEVITSPLTPSVFYMGIIVAMGYELSRDVLRTAELTRELGEREKQMDLAAQAANLGLWMRDLRRGEVWVTAKCREMFGFSVDEPLSYEAFIGRMHPGDRATTQQAVESSVAEQTFYDTEYRVVLPDGGERWIHAMGQAEYDERGQPLRMRGVCADITARKRADNEAHELRRELAHVSRVTLLGQFATTLAHELNQPLGAILRNAEAAELFLKADAPDLDEVRAILADIRKDDQRAGGVIDRMRALLKRRDLEVKPLEIAALIREVAVFICADAAARHVTIETDVPDGLPAVRGDEVQIQQVLLNLILNAMDALNGCEGERRVAVRARRDGAGAVEIVVSDTGRGIAEDQMARLFEPFFTTKPQGMGVGLAISRTIVHAHGGTIRVENNVKRGATFRVALPVEGGA